MNFVNSFLLWTAAGASLPFLIHMLNREKPRRIVIPTVEFIIKAVEKSAGSRKLNNFLLLIVRMLILLCISMIIARPQIEKFLSMNNTGALQCVIIIDNSFYTAHSQSGSTQLALIKEKARKIINAQPAGSQICILSTDESDSEFTEIKTYALDKVETISPAPGLIDTRSMISSAADILKDSELKKSKKIYVISDMNQGSWEGNYTVDNKLKDIIHLVPVSQRRGNIYVSSINVKSEGATGTHRVYARRNVQIQSEVRGDRSLEGVKAILKINSKVIDEKTITDDLDGRIVFNTSFDEDGAQFCEVILDSSDGIEEDNRFYFTINVRPPAKVFVLNDTPGRNPLFYKAALAPSGWHGRQKFNVLTMDYTELNRHLDQHSPELIIVSGSMALPDSSWSKLKLFAEQGGSLMICPDESTGYKELNQGAFSLLQSKVTPIEGAFKPIRASQSRLAERLDIETFKEVKISKAATFEEEPSGALVEVPVRYSNNQVCLLIRSAGLGEIVFWGLSPDTDASTFLISDSFALIWHRLAERFSSGGDFQQNFSCGDPVEIRGLKSEIAEYKVQSPAGTVDSLTSDSFTLSADGDYSSSYSQTEIPGHYRCTSVKFGGFSCNIPRDSGYYQYVHKDEYKSMLSKDDQKNIKSASQKFFGPDGLLLILIMATLALMVFEVHLGNRNFYAGN